MITINVDDNDENSDWIQYIAKLNNESDKDEFIDETETEDTPFVPEIVDHGLVSKSQPQEDPLENPEYGYGNAVGSMSVEKEFDSVKSKIKRIVSGDADTKGDKANS